MTEKVKAWQWYLRQNLYVRIDCRAISHAINLNNTEL